MKIATYLKPIISNIKKINESQFQANLSINENPQFNIYTNGIHEIIHETDFIMPSDGDDYLKINIGSINTIEKFVVFDGRIHGYDNLFCDEHSTIKHSLNLFEFNGSSIFSGVITLGYSIDYDDEKEDYEVDELDMVKVFNRDEKIPWQQVKEEGYDFINITFTNENGDTIEVDFELA